ncbi:Nitronate monooxygenase-domain-containing protein [Dactylonectria macrodidyma]|uniref:Nitronate monooxygenase-domain-containing protein n=1 Tax=Dactylonectria macrodidyma TaxID=307937 RepID=A0A9P9EB54_9HYPO|nr:Nitronate monooxygenase-domain-containing protein [Dactylonectria macrodidyma]
MHQKNPITPEAVGSGPGGAVDGTLPFYGVFPDHGLVHAPGSLNAIEASTLTCAPLTAWNALYGLQSKSIKAGDWVLTQGAGGGSDAGGHGHESGASIVPLIPEVVDTLRDGGFPDISLIAAGGIMDGRATAAALALEASGVVLGTRFLGGEEAKVPAEFHKIIFETSDGDESTARSRAFDAMWGLNIWPDIYDGRCLKNSMYQNVKHRMFDKEARIELQRDLEQQASQDVSIKNSMSNWASTGVGMVNKIERQLNFRGSGVDTD